MNRTNLCIRMLQLLKARGKMNTTQLATELEVNPRNIREFKKELVLAGYNVEEVDEFLRNIPKAIEAQVIIFAMTNHIDMIDKAVLRKGRFDQIIEVGMPTKEEVLSVLTNSLNKLPCEDNIDLDKYAEILEGQPMSDVAFVIREASRTAVRNRSKVIKDEYIDAIVKELISKKKYKQERRKIGF